MRVELTAANTLFTSGYKKDKARQLLFLASVRAVDGVRGPEVGGAAEVKEDVAQGSIACTTTDSRGEEST